MPRQALPNLEVWRKENGERNISWEIPCGRLEGIISWYIGERPAGNNLVYPYWRRIEIDRKERDEEGGRGREEGAYLQGLGPFGSYSYNAKENIGDEVACIRQQKRQ